MGGGKLIYANLFPFPPRVNDQGEFDYGAPKHFLTAFKSQFSAIEQLVSDSRGQLMLVRNTADLDRCLESDAMGLVPTLEGIPALNRKTWVKDMEEVVKAGIVSAALMWNLRSALGEPPSTKNDKGLSDFGADVVRFFVENGIVIDVSHSSIRTAEMAREIVPSDRLIIATHAGSRELNSHARNLPDSLALTLDGIGIPIVKTFIHRNGEASVETYVDQYEYFVSLGLQDKLFIGSDFLGMFIKSWVPGMSDVGIAYPAIRNELARRGIQEPERRAFMFDNAERLTRRAFDIKERLLVASS